MHPWSRGSLQFAGPKVSLTWKAPTVTNERKGTRTGLRWRPEPLECVRSRSGVAWEMDPGMLSRRATRGCRLHPRPSWRRCSTARGFDAKGRIPVSAPLRVATARARGRSAPIFLRRGGSPPAPEGVRHAR